MSDFASPVESLVRKLASRHRLEPVDRAAIMTLPYKQRTYERASHLLREGDPKRTGVRFLQSGLAYRHKIASSGARQIFGFLLSGDTIDFQQILLNRADHNVQAATAVEVVEVERLPLEKLAFSHPAIGRALWLDSLVTASILQEWLLNVGRRDARSRVAHFLCEFTTRMDEIGMSRNGQYEFRITQEHVADATGLTAVHVNRMLRSLMADKAIAYEKPFFTVIDRKRLWSAAGFNTLYLHLDQTEARLGSPGR